jgi:prepilin-type processing-associated H-X9-DG protein
MRICSKKCRGLTLIETLVIIVVMGLLALFLLPFFAKAKQHSGPTCVNNLKQIGLAFRIWANDNGGQFPMQLSTNDGGIKEVNGTLPIYGYFQLLKNKLGTPKILFCPNDKKRKPVLNFDDLEKTRCSYFIGIDAATNYPSAFLAGDRNITNGFLPKRDILELTANSLSGFTEKIHNRQGNIAMADGSARIFSSVELRTNLIPNTGLATNRILLP